MRGIVKFYDNRFLFYDYVRKKENRETQTRDRGGGQGPHLHEQDLRFWKDADQGDRWGSPFDVKTILFWLAGSSPGPQGPSGLGLLARRRARYHIAATPLPQIGFVERPEKPLLRNFSGPRTPFWTRLDLRAAHLKDLDLLLIKPGLGSWPAQMVKG